ncbi:serine hydrolase [bacterium]|nr:serine hydrolase [bacterium]
MATPLRSQSSLEYSNVRTRKSAIIRRFPKKKVVKKKKFSILGAVKFLISTAFVGAAAYYTIPYNYYHFIEPMFVNHVLNAKINYDVAPLVAPTTSYISNAVINQTPILLPIKHASYGLAPIIPIAQNVKLTKHLENIIKNYPQFETSVFVFDFTTGTTVEINSDKAIPCASMIKIPILFELFRQIENNKNMEITDKVIFEKLYKTSGSGNLQYYQDDFETTFNKMAELMITDSDNSATNLLLDYIGGKDNMNRAFRYWGLKNSEMPHFLPDLEGGNKMSTRDLGTLMYNLDNPNFLSVRSREYIKDYMGAVKTNTLLPQGLEEGSIIYHKTGDIGTYVGDTGVIYTKNGKKYIASIIVKRRYNDHAAKGFIQKISSTIYKNIEYGI